MQVNLGADWRRPHFPVASADPFIFTIEILVTQTKRTLRGSEHVVDHSLIPSKR